MAINIKNNATCDLARELAELTGDTMTNAITIALHERIEHVKRERDRDELRQDLRAIAKRCAAKMGPGPSATEHGDFLYDEYGLPK